jgi:hypothetical protein
MDTASANPSASNSSAMPRPAVRIVVSILVALHVFAIFLGPFAMPPQASELASTFADVFRPYVDILSMANGYRFFAPEPGPSHIVRYELTFDDGSTREGFFPNREVNKPRLLYHRYFMMSEFLNTLENPSAPRDRVQTYANGYAQHLAHAEGAKSVRLFLRRHWVPRMEEVRSGTKLSDKVLYVEHPLGTFQRDDS